jgi:hypothetical protein
MNEAHDGLRRCVRTREVGRELLPVAHALGVRHLAMEALGDPGVAERANVGRVLEGDLGGYLDQPELRLLVSAALDLGWTLHAYEADIGSGPFTDNWGSQEAINWREDQQARNLGAVVSGLQPSARILAWCGGGHLYRKPYEVTFGEGEPSVWTPMGSLVAGYCGVEPFAIDQIGTVESGPFTPWLDRYADDLRARGGTAGFLAADLPDEISEWRAGRVVDAYVLSLENSME